MSSGQIIKIKVSETPKVQNLERFNVLGLDRETNQNAHATMEQLRGNTAYQEWAAKNPGSTYQDYLNFLRKPATDAADRLNKLSDHRDEIRDGYWWRWNETTGEWYNTGETAKGNVLYASLEIDPMTGILYMIVDDEYKGATFFVEDGILYSTINT